MQRPDGGWDNPAIIPVKLDGEEQFRCPRRAIKDHPEFWGELLPAFRLFRRGLLPDGGAWMHQPAQGIRLLMYLDALFDQVEAERLEEVRSQERRKGAARQ